MRLLPWDPDIGTVISRIESGALDLQPNFQRGEVWPKSKKQRLIDSVLRDWHVPPIHVIEHQSTKKQEVLDGQQRLAAIRDFVRGEFEVDGATDPIDLAIEQLHGLKYRSLPESVRRQFDQFTLRIYRVTDFKPSEPAELFYRLNQPSNLTGAEQRNAFYGPIRDQIRSFIALIEEEDIGKEEFGFTNARMAYDDVVCRFALTAVRGTIAAKITGNDLVELYRSEVPLTEEQCAGIRACLALAMQATKEQNKPKFNKATLYSWLVFFKRGLSEDVFRLQDVELIKGFLRYFTKISESYAVGSLRENYPLGMWMDIYDDRAKSRVADVSSIVLRDLIIWALFIEYAKQAQYESQPLTRIAIQITEIFEIGSTESESVARTAIDRCWGDL